MEQERRFEELTFVEQMDAAIANEPPVIGLHHRMIYFKKEYIVDLWEHLRLKMAFAAADIDTLSPSDIFAIQFLVNRFDIKLKNQEPS